MVRGAVGQHRGPPETASLPVTSTKMFSLAALYDANQELIGGRKDDEDVTEHQLTGIAAEYWATVAKHMIDWDRVKKERVLARELRRRASRLTPWSCGRWARSGAELLEAGPNGWKARLQALRQVDWRKSNADWDGVNIVANSVVSNRQARAATKAYLKKQLGLEITDAELRSITPASVQEQEAEV